MPRFKAIEKNATYEEVTDKDQLGVFLPQVKFINASASKSSKQNWEVELKSGDDKVTLFDDGQIKFWW